MMQLLRVVAVFAIFSLAAVASRAWAADVSIGGVPIKLPPPAGFCDLSASQPSDNRALTLIGGMLEKGNIKLLAFSADCQQLADWRAGKQPFLDDYAQVQATIPSLDQEVASPKPFIHEMCETLRAQGTQINSMITSDVKSKIEGALTRVKMNSLEFVGVLAEDDTACYAAQIQKMSLPTGAEKTQLNLMGITVVKTKPINVIRYSQYASTDATSGLLTKLKGTIGAVQAANK